MGSSIYLGKYKRLHVKCAVRKGEKNRRKRKKIEQKKKKYKKRKKKGRRVLTYK